MKEVYQEIYEKLKWYGNSETGHSPGVRYIPKYKDWLIGPIIDLGCGRGDTVRKLRELGFLASGIDFVNLANDMSVGDITKPIDNLPVFKTSLCLDVFEHVDEAGVEKILENMKQTDRQVITAANEKSFHCGHELHINIKTFDGWKETVGKHLTIVESIIVQKDTILLLCKKKSL